MDPQYGPQPNEALAARVRLWQTARDLALLFATAGLIALLAAGVGLLQTRSLLEWLPAESGVITRSEIQPVQLTGRVTYTREAVTIAYDYVYGGQMYSSTTIGRREAPVLAGTAEADRLLAEYPLGAAVPVFVNPSDPAQSVLRRGLPIGLVSAAFILLGVALATGALALFIRSRLGHAPR